ncbi:transmembrane protein 138 isoform X1 [Odocoileus virginianus]|uniref:Transmembrane protein 138 n=1 Tax=Odocoileus virginianus TaxID=9874 RepID=A0A6J0ZEN3_ODOVR
MFRPRRSLWPGAGRPQGGARGEREALAGSRSPGTGRGDTGKAWREASPGKRGLKHGGRVGLRAGRESRGQPCSTAQDEPTSAIYFRNLKPASGSQGDIPMTTDVGPPSIQDIAILFNIIIIFLMFFNTFVFQAGLVNLLFHKFKGTIILTAVYFALSISLHVWVMNLRWKNSNRFVWTDGLQTLFVFQRLAAVLYCYFYKRTAVRLGDPRFYQDSLWLRKEFMQVRR